MLKVEEKVTFIWQNIHPEKFDPYTKLTITEPDQMRLLSFLTVFVS